MYSFAPYCLMQIKKTWHMYVTIFLKGIYDLFPFE